MSEVSPEFVRWWARHEHRLAITPGLAWRCDLYRIEFAKETGNEYYCEHLISADNPTGAAHKPKELQDDIL